MVGENLNTPNMDASDQQLPLKYERAGQHAIQINATYRICFRWTDAGAEDVEITDYHD